MLSTAAQFGKQLVEECGRNKAVMNPDQGVQLLEICMMNARSPIVVTSAYRDLQNKDSLTKIMHGRIRWFLGEEERIEPAMLLMFRLFMETPADAVMLAAVVCYMREAAIPLTLDRATAQVFALYVPDRAALTTVWDAQKVRHLDADRLEYAGKAKLDSDNQLDFAPNWQAAR